MVGERLGLGVIPAAGWTVTDIQDVAREAEAAGFDAIFKGRVEFEVLRQEFMATNCTDVTDKKLPSVKSVPSVACSYLLPC